MSILYENAGYLIKWLKEPEAEKFYEWVKDFHEHEYRQLKKCIEPHELYRAQGRIDILDQLLRMKEDLVAEEQRKRTLGIPHKTTGR